MPLRSAKCMNKVEEIIKQSCLFVAESSPTHPLTPRQQFFLAPSSFLLFVPFWVLGSNDHSLQILASFTVTTNTSFPLVTGSSIPMIQASIPLLVWLNNNCQKTIILEGQGIHSIFHFTCLKSSVFRWQSGNRVHVRNRGLPGWLKLYLKISL